MNDSGFMNKSESVKGNQHALEKLHAFDRGQTNALKTAETTLRRCRDTSQGSKNVYRSQNRNHQLSKGAI
ncbi:hypothetical protein PO124_29000 [Bacillus licheniformis]|nr:hypothetical protein [Bacillus licheniformis]